MLECRAQINEFLRDYFSRPSKTPRLQLVWTVSSRTLRKMKPSTKVLYDLEPIMEDEDDEGGDAGRFDRFAPDSSCLFCDSLGDALVRPLAWLLHQPCVL